MNLRAPLEGGFRCSGSSIKTNGEKIGTEEMVPWRGVSAVRGSAVGGDHCIYIYIYCFIFSDIYWTICRDGQVCAFVWFDDGELEILCTLDKSQTAAVSERKRRSREKSCLLRAVYSLRFFHRNTPIYDQLYPTGNVLAGTSYLIYLAWVSSEGWNNSLHGYCTVALVHSQFAAHFSKYKFRDKPLYL